MNIDCEEGYAEIEDSISFWPQLLDNYKCFYNMYIKNRIIHFVIITFSEKPDDYHW